MWATQTVLVIGFLLFQHISLVLTSDGDGSQFYKNCVKRCMNTNCMQDGSFTAEAFKELEFWNWAMRWSCRDECRYPCMWKTVEAFKERGYELPKFHGKWPFARLFGVQEPASAFASFLNLVAHVYMHYEMTSHFPVKTTPLLTFWHVFAVICENAWVWSIIFHTRDTVFTEFMDYACALSMVMALLAAAIVRIFHGRRKQAASLALLLFLFCYYVAHVRYLYHGRIDYGYNMTVNVVFGVSGGALWMLWAGAQQLRGRRAARLQWFAALSAAALALELLDFAPRAGWDAHALWHLATAPLPLLFYRFVIDDLQYLLSEKQSAKSSAKLS